MQIVSSCIGCGAGKYSQEIGRIDNTRCLDCNTGKKQPLIIGQCEDCPIGKSQNVIQSINCKFCTIGLYNDQTGMIFCKECEAGMYSATNGRTQCLNCLAGRYLTEMGQSVCTNCPVGRSKEVEGSFNECGECSSGKYQPNTQQTYCKVSQNFLLIWHDFFF